MKKGFLALFILALSLLGCKDESPEIKLIKNGTLFGYNNITIGQAFDNSFGSTEWRYFVTAKGVKVVEMRGNIDVAFPIFFRPHLRYDSNGSPNKFLVQFIIEANGTSFKISSVSLGDYIFSQKQIENILNFIYSDHVFIKPLIDVSKIMEEKEIWTFDSKWVNTNSRDTTSRAGIQFFRCPLPVVEDYYQRQGYGYFVIKKLVSVNMLTLPNGVKFAYWPENAYGISEKVSLDRIAGRDSCNWGRNLVCPDGFRKINDHAETGVDGAVLKFIREYPEVEEYLNPVVSFYSGSQRNIICLLEENNVNSIGSMQDSVKITDDFINEVKAKMLVAATEYTKEHYSYENGVQKCIDIQLSKDFYLQLQKRDNEVFLDTKCEVHEGEQVWDLDHSYSYKMDDQGNVTVTGEWDGE